MGSAFDGDGGLLERFRRGERSALEQIYWAYVSRVERLVRRLLHPHGGQRLVATVTVEDFVQDTFTRAFSPSARQSFDGVRDYGPYLLAIVRNTVVEALRLGQREVLASGAPIEAWMALEEVAAASDDPSNCIDPATLSRVRDYLSRLPLDLKSVHHHRYVLDQAQDEAASALGLSRQRIRTLEKKLRLGLVRELKKRRGQEISTGVASSTVLRRT
jgi:RNA polymerase sigma factor (sigma-70 family)